MKSYAKVFFPTGFSPASNAAAVIVAPNAGDTAANVESQAAALAQRGMVAMAIDYRGWGKSGAFIYLADPVRWDDRLRFSQHTAKVRLRRGRLIPEAQVIDIRNAITYHPGRTRRRRDAHRRDRGRTGGRARGRGGRKRRAREGRRGHRGRRSRQGRRTQVVRAGRGAAGVDGELARTGQAPATEAAATAMNGEEQKIALAEYQPFRYADQIPKDTAMLYLDGKADAITAAADFLAKSLTKTQ